MTRPTFVHIDLAALQHNFQQVQTIAPGSKIIAMVKGNAYGHGAVEVAKALDKADAFGVACIEEARLLREAGCQQRIILMGGFFAAEELSQIVQLHCDVVIHHVFQIEILEQQLCAQPVSVWMKVNTGMNRLGFLPEEATSAYKRLSQCPAVSDIRLMSHFSDADLFEDTKTQHQIKIFKALADSLSIESCLANSGGIIAYPESHLDWIRPGIMLYGISPMEGCVAEQQQLKPVMHFYSRIMAIHQQKAGDAIGYGSAWRCPENMPVGVVAVGYGDGYPRHAISGTPIVVNGYRTQLIGRVSMDMLTVDLRPCPQAQIGDEVTLWGEGLPVEIVAAHANTIAYELVSGIGRRVHKN